MNSNLKPKYENGRNRKMKWKGKGKKKKRIKTPNFAAKRQFGPPGVSFHGGPAFLPPPSTDMWTPRVSPYTRVHATGVPPLSGPPLSSGQSLPFLPRCSRVAASRGPPGSPWTATRLRLLRACRDEPWTPGSVAPSLTPLRLQIWDPTTSPARAPFSSLPPLHTNTCAAAFHTNTICRRRG